MLEDRNAGDDKLKVFVSYSRRDLQFADQIVAVLTWHGFLPTIDRKGIHGAEKWEQRLGQLILESDVVVFVLSPDSATSKVCHWEVDQAVSRGKRIIPVVCRPLESNAPHEQLRGLNYVHFYADKDLPSSGFGTGLTRLIDALSVDIVWLREHTRFEELAARWDENHRDPDLLVRGSELEACQRWRDQRPTNASELTNLQRAYLIASEEEQALRANVERNRLKEVDAAQTARQVAIDEREVAIEREIKAQADRKRLRFVLAVGSIASASIIVIGALWFAQQQAASAATEIQLRTVALTEKDEALRQKTAAEKNLKLAVEQKKTVDDLIQRIRLGISTDHGIAAMRKICDEAVLVTSNIANTFGAGDYVNDEQRFWELFFGPMNLVEIRQKTDDDSDNSNEIKSSRIEVAMVTFGEQLKIFQSQGSDDFRQAALRKHSLEIKTQCDAYLHDL